MSSTNTFNPEWIVAYASVIGNGHIQQDLPCQDSCTHQFINERWGIAVVCDGAGSAAHSEKGSDFVARNTVYCLAEAVEGCQWLTASELPDEQTWRTEAVVALHRVRQRLGMFAENNHLSIKDLACTVIATIHTPNGLLVAHIGDGRAAYRSGGVWQPMIVPFKGSEANETVFITSDIWTNEGIDLYIRTHVIHAPIEAFTLASDGSEKGSFLVNVFNENTQKYEDLNQPYPKFFDPNIQGLLQLHREQRHQSEINQLWAGFLRNGHQQFQHETDDKTLILGVYLQ